MFGDVPLYDERPLADHMQSCLIEFPITAALNQINFTYRAVLIDKHS
jgi:hypothetical protein